MAEIKAKISLDNKEFINGLLSVERLTAKLISDLKSGFNINPKIDTKSITQSLDEVQGLALELDPTINAILDIDASALGDVEAQIDSVDDAMIEVPIVSDMSDFDVDLPDVDSIDVPIVADTSGVQGLAQEFGGIGSEAGANFNKGFASSLSRIKDVALGGVLGSAITSLIPDIGAARELAKVQEQAEAGVRAVLTATGKASQIAIDDVTAIATSFQKVTTFGDEATLQAQKVLLSFQNLANTKEELTDLTSTTLDLAAAMGGDPVSAAQTLGRALEDPANASRVLRQANILLSEAEREHIKTLAESGRTLEAQELIIASVSERYGGFAEALAQTDSGQLTQVSNRFGDIQEQIGLLANKLLVSLSPTIDSILTLVEDLMPLFAELAQSISPVIQSIATAFQPLLSVILNLVNTALKPYLEAVVKIAVALEPVFKIITGLIGTLVDALAPVLNSVYEILSTVIVDLLATVAKLLVPIMAILTPLIGVLSTLITSALKPIGAILKVVTQLIDVFADVLIELTKPLVELVQVFLKLYEPLLEPFYGLIEQLVKVLPPLIKLFGSLVTTFIKVTNSLQSGILKAIGDLIAKLFGAKDASDFAQKAMKFLTDSISILTKVIEISVGALTAFVDGVAKLTNDVLVFLGIVERTEKKAPFKKAGESANDLSNAIVNADGKLENLNETLPVTATNITSMGGAATGAAKKIIDLSNVINNLAGKRIDLYFDIQDTEVDRIQSKLNNITIAEPIVALNTREADESFEALIRKSKESKKFFETESGGVWLDEPTLKLKETIQELDALQFQLNNLSKQELIEFNLKDVLNAQNEFINSISDVRESTNSALLKRLETEKQNILDFIATANELDDAQIQDNLKRVRDLNNQIVNETIRSGQISNKERENLDKAYVNSLDFVYNSILRKEKENQNKILELIAAKRKEIDAKITESEIKQSELRLQQASKLEDLRIANISDALARDRAVRLRDLEARYKREYELAVGNLELTNALLFEYRKEQRKIIEETTPKNVFDTVRESAVSLIKSLSKPANVDLSGFKKQRDEINLNISKLDDQLKRGEISYKEYVNKIKDYERQLTEVSKNENKARFDVVTTFSNEITNLLTQIQTDAIQTINDGFKSAIDDFMSNTERMSAGLEGLKQDTIDWGEAITQMGASIGLVFGATLGKSLAEGENFFKAVAKSAIDTAQILINAWAAALLVKENATLPLGLGTIAFAGIMAAANALLTLAKGALGAEDGVVGISKSYNKKAGKTDTIPLMVAAGESIINKEATRKNKKYLEIINSGGDLNEYFTKLNTKEIAQSVIFVNESLPSLKNMELKIDSRIDERFNDLDRKLDKLIVSKMSVNTNVAVESSLASVSVSGDSINFMVTNAQKTRLRRL